MPSRAATRRPRRPPRHNPQARHDAADALRKPSDGQLLAQNIPICAVASLPQLDPIAAPNGGSVRVAPDEG